MIRFLCLILSCCCLTVSLRAQEFYYYQHEKLFLDVNMNYISVLTNASSKEELQTILSSSATVTSFQLDSYPQRLNTTYRHTDSMNNTTMAYFAEIKLGDAIKSKEDLQRFMLQLKGNQKIKSVAFYYSHASQPRFSVHDKLWVQLKDSSQRTLLQQEAERIHYDILGQHPFMPEWFMLEAKSNLALHPFKASQQLVESNLFVCAEPDMYHAAISTCVNDSLFTSQWALANTNNGIRACSAWGLSTGSGINIAILDEGFENNHPDLSPNVINTGYNAIVGSSPTAVYGPHGTACAGIAAARSNNTIGTAGVAPNAQLSSVSVLFSNSAGIQGNTTSAQWGDAILWPMNQGADVISNSWSTASSAVITTALFTALTNGRNGKGCVIVFATGNDSLSGIAYPANALPGIMAVGNLRSDGYRNFSSNYGSGLDVMAPGTTIATSDQQGSMGYNANANLSGNYTDDFNGTSAACPHVAGLAALILSVNPCLTSAQVSQVINRSARKIFGYLYSVNGPDGTWNNETGYGLIDAEAAVKMSLSMYLQNLTNTTTQYYKYPIIQAGYSVNNFSPYGNYTTSTSANVTLEAKYQVNLEPGCDLQGSVNIIISNAFGSCDTW